MRSAALLSLGVGSLALVAVGAACSLTTSFDKVSGGVAPDTGTDGSTDGGSGAPAVPPARPAGPVTPSGGKTLFLGAKHFHFNHSNDALKKVGAWQDWGFDIDGLCTGAAQTAQAGTCIHNAAIGSDQVQDGNNCRDNNFGSQIIPLLNVYNDKFETDTNGGLTLGSATLMFELDDLGDGADDPYVPGQLYILQKTADKMPPAWDGTDQRPVLPQSVVGGDVKTALVKFPKGYLAGNTWVSGDPQDLKMAIPIGKDGELMPMQVVHTIFAMKLTDTHVNAVDGTGMMAGAIPTANLEAFLKPFLLTQTSFCPGDMQYNIFKNRVTTFADVVVGAPTLQDSTKQCDGVSFGIGFNMAPVAGPTMVGTDPVPSNGSCDAGVDSSAETGTDSDAATDGG